MGQATYIERIQKSSLKMILGENYVSYQATLEMTGLQTLYDSLNFALKALKNPRNDQIFPRNENNFKQIQNQQFFQMNFARNEHHSKLAISFCQRKFNEYLRT